MQAIAEIEKRCARAKPGREAGELIEERERVWVRGRPAPAGEASVAVEVDAHTVIAARRGDVVAAEANGETVGYAVAPGAPLAVTRTEVVAAREPLPLGCACGDAPPVAARRPAVVVGAAALPGARLGIDMDPVSPGEPSCTVEWSCFTVLRNGEPQEVCLPRWVCRPVDHFGIR